MTDQRDGSTPYEVLGVSPDVSAKALRRAYRRALRRSHPDTGGDPEEFMLVQEAWASVGTPAARRRYDATHAGSRPGGTASAGPTARPRRQGSGGPAAQGPIRPWRTNGRRVWTAGTTSGGTRAPSKARSHGHPGGWSRERYLTLLREWVGRGVPVPDPYDEKLIASAPREIRLALADAQAEEATATLLADLGSAFTIWHDVATGYGNETWARDASAPVTDPAKLDHVVLGPTGLLVVQSEDWGAPARPKGRDLTSAGLAKGAHPVRDLARRAKVARKWRVRLSALIVVLDDDALDVDFAQLGRPGSLPRFAVRRSELISRVAGGLPGVQGLTPGAIFDVRTALQNSIRFV